MNLVPLSVCLFSSYRQSLVLLWKIAGKRQEKITRRVGVMVMTMADLPVMLLPKKEKKMCVSLFVFFLFFSLLPVNVFLYCPNPLKSGIKQDLNKQCKRTLPVKSICFFRSC